MEYKISVFFGCAELEQEYRAMPDGIACFSRRKEIAQDGAVTYTEWEDLGSRITGCTLSQFRAMEAGDFSVMGRQSLWERIKAAFRL